MVESTAPGLSAAWRVPAYREFADSIIVVLIIWGKFDYFNRNLSFIHF